MKNLYALCVLLCSSMLAAQYAPFTPLSSASTAISEKRAPNAPARALYFATKQPAEFAAYLAAVPEERGTAREESSLLTLPAPDGSVVTFRVQRYQIIQPELRAVYPSYVTLYGWDVKNPGRRVQLDWTDRGFGASVVGGEEGRWFVEPLSEKRVDQYESFFAKDVPFVDDGSRECGFVPDEKVLEELRFHANEKRAGDCELREYRVAIACTGEYYAAVGGTEARVVAEIMRAVNRLNQLFAAEISLQLILVNLPVAGGGVELLYNNPNSDPYTNSENATMLDENQNTIDAVIGSDNYDIGHVFGTGGGGVAQLGSVCGGGKARGVSGQPVPLGDPFYVDLVAHEMGHQFGATHTFNSDSPNCGPNRTARTAFETGSGSTIMSYAGICGPASNVQLGADPHYHAASIAQIATYMELGGGSTCARTTSSDNSEPTAQAGADYSIPAGTPFVLTAAGADPDGDGITYNWDQFDAGPALDGMPTGSEVVGPLFRSFSPKADPRRYFPNLPAVVTGEGSPWEVLPTVARQMNFAVTVRDFGAAGYGCPTQDLMVVDVVNTGAPFAITAPNGAEAYPGGSTQTFTWNVAGTNAGAINCATVDLVLSTDGGLTFTDNIGSYPNTGSASVNLPAVTERDVRLMIKCADNIFYDVSDQDFSIEQEDYAARALTGAATACDGINSAEFTFELESVLGYVGSINYAAQDLPTGASASFAPATTTLTANGTETVAMTLTGLSAVPEGTYPFTVLTDDGSVQKTVAFSLQVLGPLAAPTLLTPNDGGFLSPASAGFDWRDVPNVDAVGGYTLSFFNDAAGTDRRGGSEPLNGSTANFGAGLDGFLTEGDTYWWSVTAQNTTCDPTQTATSVLNQFTFAEAPPAGQSLSGSPLLQNLCLGRRAEDFTVSFFTGDLTGPATLVLGTLPAGVTGALTRTTLTNGQNSTVLLQGTENLMAGNYSFDVTATGANGATESVTFVLDVAAGIVINSPTDGSEVLINPDGTGTIPVNFNAISGATSYTVTVTFPDGGTGTVPASTATTRNIGVGQVTNGAEYGIKVTADTGEESCVNFFTFVTSRQPAYTAEATQSVASICNGSATAAFTFQLASTNGFAGTINYEVRFTGQDLPPGTTGSFTPATTTLAANGSATVTLNLGGLGGYPAGTYPFVIRTTSGGVRRDVDIILEVLPPLAAPTLLIPAANGVIAPDNARFDWSDVEGVDAQDGYSFVIYSDAGGTMPRINPIVVDASRVNFGANLATVLTEGQSYWWSVTATNTDCNPTQTATSSLHRFKFSAPSLAGSPVRQNFCAGRGAEVFSLTYTVGNLTGTASLSLGTLPAGVTGSLAPAQLNDTERAIITLQGAESLPLGTYTFDVDAVGALGEEESLAYTLVVTSSEIVVNTPQNRTEVLINQDGSGTISLDFQAVAGATDYTANVVFANGSDGTAGPFTFNSGNIGIGPVQDGDEINIQVVANTGEQSCFNTVIFVDMLSVLPVEWLSFAARPQVKSVELTWSVRQDAAHEYFVIERTTDLGSEWHKFGEVTRRGADGVADYRFMDQTVAAATTYFYRLRQVDADGTFSHSDVETVTFAGRSRGVTLYPNPVTDRLFIDAAPMADGSAGDVLEYQLVTNFGQVVRSGILSGQRSEIDVANLPNAVYQIMITNGTDFRKTFRVVKQ
ncbi:reprolysin-like metallopeptidase [Neolewinella antarctica]|uniref:Peptidase M12B domain-containing protein n=1 Tax=Neolewinella antarctica TaxID=442734 RepID=A0ABX0XB25_9BACT|nr:M12 family metallo-peptidase [Neolewinella antarctica]NJC25982.1 hypothetical protein [Neolewinella antarctica]